MAILALAVQVSQLYRYSLWSYMSPLTRQHFRCLMGVFCHGWIFCGQGFYQRWHNCFHIALSRLILGVPGLTAATNVIGQIQPTILCCFSTPSIRADDGEIPSPTRTEASGTD